MLTAIGNLLDLPGSMARDAIMLRNPLDQLLDPFSQENRTSGQDILNNFGLQDSPWLSLALEMGLDPTTYVGYGALSKGAKGLGLVSKGASGAKTVGRAAKALGKAALHPQDTITWLSHLPRRMRGREGEILSGLRAQAENAFAGVKSRFTSPVTEAKGALDEAVKAGAAPTGQKTLMTEVEELFDKTYGTGSGRAAPLPRETVLARKKMASDDMLSWLSPDELPLYEQSVASSRKDIAKMARDMRGQSSAREAVRAEINSELYNRSKENFSRFTGGVSKRDQRKLNRQLDEYLSAISSQRSPVSSPVINASEAMNQQVADSALSRVRKGFSLSGLADSTIYNPDALRMAMGFMAMNSAAAGRAQNPTSHAYMGYYE